MYEEEKENPKNCNNLQNCEKNKNTYLCVNRFFFLNLCDVFVAIVCSLSSTASIGSSCVHKQLCQHTLIYIKKRKQRAHHQKWASAFFLLSSLRLFLIDNCSSLKPSSSMDSGSLRAVMWFIIIIFAAKISRAFYFAGDCSHCLRFTVLCVFVVFSRLHFNNKLIMSQRKLRSYAKLLPFLFMIRSNIIRVVAEKSSSFWNSSNMIIETKWPIAQQEPMREFQHNCHELQMIQQSSIPFS